MTHPANGETPLRRKASPGGHEVVPVAGTFTRVRDGEPVNPPMPWDYPVTAECRECHLPARKKSLFFSDWVHTEVNAGSLPVRIPALQRVAAFSERRPDIPITPWNKSPSGKWESQEPGQTAPKQWDNSTAMMNHLEAAYPAGDDDG